MCAMYVGSRLTVTSLASHRAAASPCARRGARMEVAKNLTRRLMQVSMPKIDPPAVLSKLPHSPVLLLRRLAPRESKVGHALSRLSSPACEGGLSKMLEMIFTDSRVAPALSMGLASSMANRDQFSAVTGKLFHVYSKLEKSLDESESPAVRTVWDNHGDQLRRADRLAADLKDLGAWPPAEPTFETHCYLLCLREDAETDKQTGSARLVGHAYTRYASDLFSEAMLSELYCRALGLAPGSPKRFSFDLGSLEPLYATLDRAGELAGTDEARFAILDAAERASRCNLHLHEEGGPATLGLNSARGLRRVLFGYPQPAKQGWVQRRLAAINHRARRRPLAASFRGRRGRRGRPPAADRPRAA